MPDNELPDPELAEFLAETATRHRVPGAAVGVWADGRVRWACHGVTNVANPEPVDRDTVFVIGSVAKTFTATAIQRLVAEGRVELDAPVRRYVPELVLPDEHAAATITVAQLLNHTAGLDWRLAAETGEQDDALARYVAELAEVPLIAAPGERSAYSQAGYNLAGRIIEKVTGQTFEQAIATLLLDPVGLRHTGYFPSDVRELRCATGHTLDQQDRLSAVRQWKDNRANNPGADVLITVTDLLNWGRFHLGDGTGAGGDQVLPAPFLWQMREPTVGLRGSSMGEAVGICWFLRDIDGVRTAGHGGSANGQFAELLLVPERDFAVVVMSNAGPDGGLATNRAVLRWSLQHYLGVVDRDPEPLPFDPVRAKEIAGRYENDLMTITIAVNGAALTVACALKPEFRASTDTELPPDLPPTGLGLLPSDEYIVTGGGLAGQRGFFSRASTGEITAMDLGGRPFVRAGS